MKANSRTIFIMAMAASSIQMEIITLVIGLMESGLVMGVLWIKVVGYMKASGSTVSSWVIDHCT